MRCFNICKKQVGVNILQLFTIINHLFSGTIECVPKQSTLALYSRTRLCTRKFLVHSPQICVQGISLYIASRSVCSTRNFLGHSPQRCVISNNLHYNLSLSLVDKYIYKPHKNKICRNVAVAILKINNMPTFDICAKL